MNIKELLLLEALTAKEKHDKFYAGKLRESDFYTIISIDPTVLHGRALAMYSGNFQTGAYFNYLIGKYKKLISPKTGKVNNNKLEKVKADLILFNKIKGTLENKDINSYSLKQLHDIVNKEENMSVAEKKAAEIEKKADASKIRILYDDNRWTLWKVLTMAGAIYLSFKLNARWCTGTKGANMYDNYAQKANLYVIHDKRIKESYQYSPPPNSEFADSKNTHIDFSAVKKAFPKNMMDVLDKEVSKGKETVKGLPETKGKDFTSPVYLKQFLGDNKIKISDIRFEIKNYRNKEIIWLDGNWKDGTWKDGTWLHGNWKDGTWKDGTWRHGFWYNGTWENGTWESGTWEDGTWKKGTWKDGTWKNGTWESGTWEDGTWKSGYIYNFKKLKLIKTSISPKEYPNSYQNYSKKNTNESILNFKNEIKEEFKTRVKSFNQKEQYEVYINPTQSEIKEIIKETNYDRLRYIIDVKEKNVYVFSAHSLHMPVARALNIPYDYNYVKTSKEGNILYMYSDGRFINGKINFRSEDAREIEFKTKNLWLKRYFA